MCEKILIFISSIRKQNDRVFLWEALYQINGSRGFVTLGSCTEGRIHIQPAANVIKGIQMQEIAMIFCTDIFRFFGIEGQSQVGAVHSQKPVSMEQLRMDGHFFVKLHKKMVERFG